MKFKLKKDFGDWKAGEAPEIKRDLTEFEKELIARLPGIFEPIDEERVVLNLTLDLKHVWKEGHKPFTKGEVKLMEAALNPKEQREGWTVESLRKAWEKNTHNYFKEENIAISKFLAHLSTLQPSGNPEQFSREDVVSLLNYYRVSTWKFDHKSTEVVEMFLSRPSQAKPSGETDQPETFSKRDMIDFTNHVLKAINAAGRGLVCHLNVDKWKEGKQ